VALYINLIASIDDAVYAAYVVRLKTRSRAAVDDSDMLTIG
jgi:hypothetical protein